jgi:hypothetical protein
MSYKYVKPAQRDNLLMVKVEIDGTEVWATCQKAVKEFAKKNFKEGDDVEFEYEEKDGKYSITGYIKKVGGAEPSSDTGDTATETAPEFACEVCGKALKDDKYPTCYTCSQAGGGGSSSEKNESIKRQAIGHMTSRVIAGLQGHIDLNNVQEQMTTIYKKFQELVG